MGLIVIWYILKVLLGQAIYFLPNKTWSLVSSVTRLDDFFKVVGNNFSYKSM